MKRNCIGRFACIALSIFLVAAALSGCTGKKEELENIFIEQYKYISIVDSLYADLDGDGEKEYICLFYVVASKGVQSKGASVGICTSSGVCKGTTFFPNETDSVEPYFPVNNADLHCKDGKVIFNIFVNDVLHIHEITFEKTDTGFNIIINSEKA